MAVKTNVEFAAVQKEIEFAQTEIKAAEDKVLERMLEADDLTAAMKKAEAELASETKKVDADRKAMAAEFAELKASVERIHGERTAVVASLTPQVMSTFERVAQRRNGIARSRGARRDLHDLPRAPASPGVQHRPPQRSDHPVRQLQPYPLFRARRRPRPRRRRPTWEP